MIRKKNMCFFILLFIFLNEIKVNAQSKNEIFHIPATVEEPNWVRLTNWERPNVFKIDSLISIETNASKLTKKEDELNENPYLMAYIRWRTGIEYAIQADGSVKLDKNFHSNQLKKSLKTQHVVTYGQNSTKGVANWTALGPLETYRHDNFGKATEQTNVYCMAIAPSNPSIIFAGTETGTIFKSTDKGLTWASVSDGLIINAPTGIGVDPNNENTVYVYCGTLIKSTDGGSTWTDLPAYTYGGGERILINPTTNRLFVKGTNGVYFSDDGGTTWTASKGITGSSDLYDIAFNPTSNEIIYCVGKTSTNSLLMFRSTDHGESFTSITSGIAGLPNKGARLATTIADGSIVYCISLGNTVPPKLLKSIDAGLNWEVKATSSNTSLGGGGSTSGFDMSNGQGFYDLDIAVSPTDANQVIVGSTTTYKSYDGGVNFAPLGGYYGPMDLHPDLQWIAVLGGDTYIATDGGVNYSTDFFSSSTNWSPRNYGMNGSDYWGFGQGWQEDITVGGRYHNGDAANFDLYGLGNSLAIGGGESATGHVFHGHPQTVGFDDIGTKQIPLSLNGIVSGALMNNTKWPQTYGYGALSSKLVIDPLYANTFYVGSGTTLWKSNNEGSSYSALFDFSTISGGKVWRFEVSRSNPSYIYVCTQNGLYKSTDAGVTWTKLKLLYGTSYNNADIAVNPADENEIYLSVGGNYSIKVLKSLDGGNTWVDYTGAATSGANIRFLQFQGGTNSGLYAISGAPPAKVFYRDATMTDWIDYSNNLPVNFKAKVGGLIFYRDNKIRVTGNRGIWESPLYSQGLPLAQPMTQKKDVNCSRDTINFYDYSMLNYAGATWEWSFPGAAWVSSVNDRNPRVLYNTPGSYDVTLKVTDAANNKNTKTVPGMIVFTKDECLPDVVAGKCVQMNGTTQNISLGKVDINSNNFSISCWAQPLGKQSSFSQLVSHGPYPGSGKTGFGMGFTFNGYKPNLQLCYTDGAVTYTNYSGLVCDSTKWNFVVLTYSPTGVKMYLNGVLADVNTNAMPEIDLSQSPFYINFDNHDGQGSKYKGAIDEIKFYNYALTQDEVREKMHLIQNDAQNESGLLKYFQFNNWNATSGVSYDIIGGYSASIPETNIINSSAPVSTGLVYKNTSVTSGGLQNFPNANLKMYLPPTGTYPDGEMVAFQLFENPETLPSSPNLLPGYFIINNYGTNQTISALDSINFGNLNLNSASSAASDFQLFKRPSGSLGNTWGASLGNAISLQNNTTSGSVSWGADANITEFSEFVIGYQNPTPLSIFLVDFNINSGGNALNCRWNCKSFDEVQKFELERSTDGKTFKYLATILPNEGSVSGNFKYSDFEIQTNLRYYYRVKAIGKTGEVVYTNIRSGLLENLSEITISEIFPNPVSQWCKINIDSKIITKFSFVLFNTSGQEVYRSTETIKKGLNNYMFILPNLSGGNYIATITTEGGLKVTKKIMIL